MGLIQADIGFGMLRRAFRCASRLRSALITVRRRVRSLPVAGREPRPARRSIAFELTVIALFSCVSAACEPAGYVYVDNQSGAEVLLSYHGANSDHYYRVSPGAEAQVLSSTGGISGSFDVLTRECSPITSNVRVPRTGATVIGIDETLTVTIGALGASSGNSLPVLVELATNPCNPLPP